jgi:hypothetical protein
VLSADTPEVVAGRCGRGGEICVVGPRGSTFHLAGGDLAAP